MGIAYKDERIELDAAKTDAALLALQDRYGRVHLDKMPPSEFYKLYTRSIFEKQA